MKAYINRVLYYYVPALVFELESRLLVNVARTWEGEAEFFPLISSESLGSTWQ